MNNQNNRLNSNIKIRYMNKKCWNKDLIRSFTAKTTLFGFEIMEAPSDNKDSLDCSYSYKTPCKYIQKIRIRDD